MTQKNLSPISSKGEMRPGQRYIEVIVDAFNTLHLGTPFRVIGHPFNIMLADNAVAVVRTSYRRDPFSHNRRQFKQFLGDCGVTIEGIDNQHRLFPYSPQAHAVLRRIVRHQDKVAYERLTGVHI